VGFAPSPEISIARAEVVKLGQVTIVRGDSGKGGGLWASYEKKSRCFWSPNKEASEAVETQVLCKLLLRQARVQCANFQGLILSYLSAGHHSQRPLQEHTFRLSSWKSIMDFFLVSVCLSVSVPLPPSIPLYLLTTNYIRNLSIIYLSSISGHRTIFEGRQGYPFMRFEFETK
jgi:hypothetical protein